MKRTQKTLTAIFLGFVALALLLVILYETDTIEPGTAVGNAQAEFLLTSLMELVTLAGAFLALRMFKFKTVQTELVTRKAPALLKLGTIRLLLIEAPMLSNTLFYYMYMKPTFGYLAIILALCLPFVWPSMERCVAETTEEEA